MKNLFGEEVDQLPGAHEGRRLRIKNDDPFTPKKTIMTDEQITALAREYAGKIYSNLSDKIISLRTQEVKNAERLIRFLLRRYTLVEKETVRKEYQEATAHMEQAIKSNNPLSEACGKGKRLVLKSLFPEIGKEVKS